MSNNKSYACWVSAPVWYSKGSNIEIQHGLDIDPQECICDVRLKCVAPDANSGYAVGDYASSISFYAGNVTVDPPVIPTLLQDKIILQVPDPSNSHTPFVIMSKTELNIPATVFLPNVECWQLEFRVWYPKQLDIDEQKLTADTIFYVLTTGNDTNDGLTEETALATIAGALNKIYCYDCNGFQAIIRIGSGHFAGSEVRTSALRNCRALNIAGTGETTVITGNNGIFVQESGCMINIYHVAFSVTNVAASAAYGGRINFGANNYILNAAHGFNASLGGAIYIYNSFYIDNISYCVFNARYGGTIRMAAIDIIHRQAFSVYQYVRAETGGIVEFEQNVTFTNPINVSGYKFVVPNLGLINVNGRGIDYLPGSKAGIAVNSLGGFYG